MDLMSWQTLKRAAGFGRVRADARKLQVMWYNTNKNVFWLLGSGNKAYINELLIEISDLQNALH